MFVKLLQKGESKGAEASDSRSQAVALNTQGSMLWGGYQTMLLQAESMRNQASEIRGAMARAAEMTSAAAAATADAAATEAEEQRKEVVALLSVGTEGESEADSAEEGDIEGDRAHQNKGGKSGEVALEETNRRSRSSEHKKQTETMKRNETNRINTMIETCHKWDPRVIKYKEELKNAKKAAKQSRFQGQKNAQEEAKRKADEAAAEKARA